MIFSFPSDIFGVRVGSPSSKNKLTLENPALSTNETWPTNSSALIAEETTPTYTTIIKVLRIYANSHYKAEDPITFWVSICKNMDSDSYECTGPVKLATSSNRMNNTKVGRRRRSEGEGTMSDRECCKENQLQQFEVKGDRINIETKFSYEPDRWTLHFHAKSPRGMFSEIVDAERFKTEPDLACFGRSQIEFQLKLLVLVPDEAEMV